MKTMTEKKGDKVCKSKRQFLLVMNPGSRAGRGKQRWQTWETGLNERDVDFRCVLTKGQGDAFEFACNARDNSTVVAVGGDGTINEVLDGILQSKSRGLKMGVLYSGTSPDFCQFHGIPTDPESALDTLLSKRSHKVDVVRIYYRDESGNKKTSHFACSCNVGLGASVARISNRLRPYIGDLPGTAVAVMCTLFSCKPVDLELVIDGEKVFLPEINNMTLAKNPNIASGLKLELDVRPDDGVLFLVGVHKKSFSGLCGLLPYFYTGTVTKRRDIFMRSCRRVGISSVDKTEVEFDGDPRGFLPLEVEIIPKALDLMGGIYE